MWLVGARRARVGVWLAQATSTGSSRTSSSPTDRVIYRTGVLAKHGVEIPLTRVNNINFHQGIVDRLIGAGTLEIESAGKDGESRFSHVRHPDGVQQEIYRQMEAHGRKRAGWGQRSAVARAGRAVRRSRPRTSPSSSSSSPSCATAA